MFLLFTIILFLCCVSQDPQNPVLVLNTWNLPSTCIKDQKQKNKKRDPDRYKVSTVDYINPDGSFLITQTVERSRTKKLPPWPKKYHLWSLDDRDTKKRTLINNKNYMTWYVWNRKGSILAECCNGQVDVWDVKKSKMLYSRKLHKNEFKVLDISVEGKLLAIRPEPGSVEIWNLAEDKLRTRFSLEDKKNGISSFRFVPGNQSGVLSTEFGEIIKIKILTGKIESKCKINDPKRSVNTLYSITDKSKHLAIGDGLNHVYTFDYGLGVLVNKYAHSAQIWDLDFHPRKDRLVLVFRDIVIIDAISGEKIKTISVNQKNIRCVNYSISGDEIYIGGLEKYITKISLKTGKQTKIYYDTPKINKKN